MSRIATDWYEILFHIMLEGVLITDADNRVVLTNTTANELMQWTSEQRPTLSERGWSLFRHDGRPLSPGDIPSRVVLRTGQPIHGQVLAIERPDGKRIWLRCNAAPIFENSKLMGSLVIFDNVTEQYRVLAELRDSQHKYQNLVENMSEVVYTINENFIIIYISPSVEMMFGYSPDELIGQHISIMLDRTQTRQGECNITRMLGGNDMEPRIYQVFRKSGERRWVRASGRAVMNDEQMVVHGVLVDITNRKELQDRYEETISLIGEAIRRISGSQNEPPTRPLTRREQDVVRLVAQGLSNEEIAEELGISKKTVSNRLTVLYDKLETKNRVQMALYALRNGHADLVYRHRDAHQVDRQ